MERLPLTSLAALLQDDMVPIETLQARHGSAATIAKSLLGIVPYSGKFLEIWPPANRMYYFMVPSFLNLPAFMFGMGAPKQLVSLALYASSLASGCPYCTSHTCTFALRRGVAAEKLDAHGILNHAGDSQEKYSEKEQSVIDVAVKLAQFPCKLTNQDRDELRKQMGSAADTEAVVMAMAMMGYLNKSMDALGLPLEVETYRETRNTLGSTWSPGKAAALINPDEHSPEAAPSTDGVSTYWSMVTQGPSASAFETKALAPIPATIGEAVEFLTKSYGYNFPVLEKMQNTRAARAVAAMVHEAFNPAESVIGIKTKMAVATIFATITQSKSVIDAVDAMVRHFQVDATWIQTVKTFTAFQDPAGSVKELFANAEPEVQAQLVLAHSASWSPTRIDEAVVLLCRDAKVSSPALVEVVAVVSMLQMLHRVATFYADAN